MGSVYCKEDHSLRDSRDGHSSSSSISPMKHSCLPRMSPQENILKCKHSFISHVRIEIILLYVEISLINM